MLPDANYTRDNLNSGYNPNNPPPASKSFIVDNLNKYPAESQDNPQTKGPVKALRAAIALIEKKGKDYQNPNSSIKHADHYRRGIDTLHDSLHGKIRRAQSLIESEASPQNESLLDSYMDIIAYASFCVAWINKEIDGQDKAKDIYNKPVTSLATLSSNSTSILTNVDTNTIAVTPTTASAYARRNDPGYGSDGVHHL